MEFNTFNKAYLQNGYLPHPPFTYARLKRVRIGFQG